MVVLNAYDQQRLLHLLRLLRPAPQGWIEKAQRTLLEMLTQDRTAADERARTEADPTMLRRALELDLLFRESFNADPVAAAESAGWPELARVLAREMRELVALAERITADSAYRDELHADPVTTLEMSGVPSDAAEPLLRALGASDDVLGKLPEVVAHKHEEQSIRSRLVILLLGSTAVVEKIRDVTRRA
jgi:hypothetical protein